MNARKLTDEALQYDIDYHEMTVEDWRHRRCEREDYDRALRNLKELYAERNHRRSAHAREETRVARDGSEMARRPGKRWRKRR